MSEMEARVIPVSAPAKARRVWPFRAATSAPVSARPEKSEKRDLVIWIARARRGLGS